MIICNHTKFFKIYDPAIKYYSNRLKGEDKNDCSQEIRIFILKYIDRFDPREAVLKRYVHIMIQTGFRRFILDKKRQLQFEESLHRYNDKISVSKNEEQSFIKEIPEDQFFLFSYRGNSYDSYDDLFADIVKQFDNGILVSVFFALLYNKDRKSYSQIAKMMNMKYSVFLSNKDKISVIIKRLLREKN